MDNLNGVLLQGQAKRYKRWVNIHYIHYLGLRQQIQTNLREDNSYIEVTICREGWSRL